MKIIERDERHRATTREEQLAGVVAGCQLQPSTELDFLSRGAKPDALARLRDRVETILTDHAGRLGCPAQNVRARLAFERCAAGKHGVQWLAAYRNLNRFRTSLPSVKVHDFTEQHRRQDWELGEYTADLAALLKRAVGLAWNDKLRMLTLRGLGKYRKVHASEIFKEDDVGVIHETHAFPQLRLYQDGESTPVSDLMARENHVFTVIPKAAIDADVDWRLPVFEAGPFLLAFDGAGLLLLEMWRLEDPGDARLRTCK